MILSDAKLGVNQKMPSRIKSDLTTDERKSKTETAS